LFAATFIAGVVIRPIYDHLDAVVVGSGDQVIERFPRIGRIAEVFVESNRPALSEGSSLLVLPFEKRSVTIW
jgi:hypothetical protein